MGTEPKPFLLYEKDIWYAITKDKFRVRAWVRLLRDGCIADASAEDDNVVSAVGAAIEKALERWFEKGHIIVQGHVSHYAPKDSSPRVYAFIRMGEHIYGDHCAYHEDVAKAAAFGFIVGINQLLGATT